MNAATSLDSQHILKSTVTCDMEGIIETLNEGAQTLFGYNPDELIGIKRVSVFSPGWIVLQNVEHWLARARQDGEYRTKTVFIRKDGSRFNAEIRITPTYREGKQIGYCGVTVPIETAVEPEKKWWVSLVSGLVITRAPFLSASVIPAFIAGALAATATDGPVFSSLYFILATVGVALLHLASNVFNDYFDWKSGTDQANARYFLKYSGGSRAIELGLITLEGTFRLATVLLLIAAAMGVYIWLNVGNGVLAFGLAGAFAGFFYTAPPLRLVARHGLGELAIGMAFGPLITGGVYYSVTGDFTWQSLAIGIPPGLLTSNILLINQVPDADADAKTGKNHLVVTFGKERAVLIYATIVLTAFASTLWLAQSFGNPLLFIPAGLLGIYGTYVIRQFRLNLHSRALVKANVNTIYLSIVFGVVFAICLGLG